MPSILVIEHEGRYIERIQDALSSEGWKARFVAGRPEALRAAASEQPDLVLVNSDLPGAAEMLRTFGRHQGGPGAVALIPEHQAPPQPAEVGADEVLAKPFTDQQLRLVVRRGLRPPGAAGTAGAAPGGGAGAGTAARPGQEEGPKLTSEDIFGDLLAEVDAEPEEAAEEVAAAAPVASGGSAAEEAGGEAAPPAEPYTAEPDAAEPPAAELPAADSPAAGPAAGAPVRRRGADDPEIAKRLEMTLSGVLDDARPKRSGAARTAAEPAAEAPRKRPRRGDDDVDELLNLTLSSLETPKVAKAKRRAKRDDDLDLSEIEALAGGRGRPAAKTPPTPAQPPPRRPAGAEPPAPTPPQAAVEPADDDPTAKPAAAPPAAEDPLAEPPEEPFEDVFDAGWAEADDDDEASAFAVQPPDDFEPRGLAAPEPETGAGDDEPAAATAAAPAADEDGERFGHYRLLDRIAIGGMAEVWKARMSGVEGFQKTVAIKKILPQMTDNADFIGMFIDEAKLAAQLNHPNITHIYDLGKIERDYYIAMEYVEGRNLRDVLNQARRKGMALPAGLAVLIAARLASALDYAHRKRDFDDRELELVHRDVSPQNVLLSYEGDIKLCDFGIVKAVTKATHTQMGALKGKLQYMSPEQAWGRTVDARSDIFSLGSLLFEMLTGERLFAGDNEISVLEAVRECHVRSPQGIVPDLPEGVETVVHRALEKEPDDRYENAGEMQAELEAILYRLKPTPNQADLGAWLRALDDAEPLDDEARRSFRWSSGAAPAAAGSGAAAAAATGAEQSSVSDVRPGAPPFALDPEGAAGPADGDEIDVSDLGVSDFDDLASTQPVKVPPGAKAGAGEGTGTGVGAGTDAGTGVGTGAAAGLPPAAADTPGDGTTATAKTDGTVGDATGSAAGLSGTAVAMAPPEGGEVIPEEGGRRGLWVLVAVIVLLLVLGAAWYFTAGPGAGAPTAAPETAAPVEPTATDGTDGEAATTDGEGVPEEPAAEPLDIEAMLDEQMAVKEDEIEAAVRETKEPEIERLRAELRRLQERERTARAEAAAAEAASQEAGEEPATEEEGGGDTAPAPGGGDG